MLVIVSFYWGHFDPISYIWNGECLPLSEVSELDRRLHILLFLGLFFIGDENVLFRGFLKLFILNQAVLLSKL